MFFWLHNNVSTRHKNSCDYHERIVTEIVSELLLFVFGNFNRKYTASGVRIDEQPPRTQDNIFVCAKPVETYGL